MSFWETILIAFALSMDAFSVSIAVAMGGRTPRQTFRLSWHFGLFQFFMPLIGGMIGLSLSKAFDAFSHWIAFIILGMIGGHMLWAAFKGEDEEELREVDRSKGWSLVALSTATSIDALGVGFAVGLETDNLLIKCLVIGLVAGAMSLVGVNIGRRVGRNFSTYADILGGAVLMALAAMALME